MSKYLAHILNDIYDFSNIPTKEEIIDNFAITFVQFLGNSISLKKKRILKEINEAIIVFKNYDINIDTQTLLDKILEKNSQCANTNLKTDSDLYIKLLYFKLESVFNYTPYIFDSLSKLVGKVEKDYVFDRVMAISIAHQLNIKRLKMNKDFIIKEINAYNEILTTQPDFLNKIYNLLESKTLKTKFIKKFNLNTSC